MKFFPLLFILLLIPHIHFSEDFGVHTHKINKLNLNSTLYYYGNLTINSSNQSILSNYTLIFTSPGIHHLTLHGYLKSCNLIIKDYSGFLNLLVYNSTIKFYNFTLQINGSFNSFNSNITLINSDIGNSDCSPAQEFYKSKIQMIQSKIYPPRLKSISRVIVSKYIQNGQPISKNGSYYFKEESQNFYNVSITSVKISFDYNLIQNNTIMNLTIPEYNIKFNTLIYNQNNTFSEYINLDKPINFCHSEDFCLKFNFTEKTQISVKNASISLISNCSVKIYDYTHNYIILNASSITSMSSYFMISFCEKTKNGFLNSLFKGIIESKKSVLTLINSSFPLWNDKEDLPIFLKFNSSFKFYKNVKVSFIFGNKIVIPKIKFNSSNHLLISNGKTYLCYFSQFHNMTLFNTLWEFSAGKIIKYLSFKRYEFSKGNSSFVYSFQNYSSINVSYDKSRNYDTFVYYIYLSQYGIGDPENVVIHLQNKSYFIAVSLTKGKTIEKTINVNLEKTRWLNLSITYFNGVCNISSNIFSEKIFKHILKSDNSKVPYFSLLFENQSYNSINDTVVIYTTKNNITFEITGSGFYVPLNSVLMTNKSCFLVNFTIKKGRIYFKIENLKSISILINSTKLDVKQCEYLCEPYGNYTLQYFNGNYEKKIKIFLDSSSLYICLQYYQNNRNILIDTVPSIIILFIIITYVRMRFVSVCPLCQKRIKFLERHKNH
ncbi:hypothetical protein [Caldiplasma sukawensis]